MKNLEGKVIVVTGGTSGIGEACVRHFVECGAKVVAASIQEAEGAALESELGTDLVKFVFTDVSDEASVKAMADEAVSVFGKIDGVHCNAGVWAKGVVTDFNTADWEKVMGVNVKGAFWTAKHTIPLMESTADDGLGVFLVTTSVASQIGFPAHALYCASKAALEAMIRCLATDHAGKIRAVGISPGTIDTPMLAATCEGWDAPVEELYAEVEKKIPVRRLGQPIDIAKTASFLLSKDSEYINGTVITLDGGTMGLPPW